MTPRKTINDQVNGFGAQSKAPSDGALAFAIGVSGLDLGNNLGGKFLSEPPLLNRVADVLFVCHPRKVSGGIVDFIKIFVMNIRKIFRVRHKGFGNEASNSHAALLAALAKNEMAIPRVMNGGGQYLTVSKHNAASGLVRHKAVYAAYSTKVRDLIQPFISYDGTPSFAIAHLNLHARGLFSAWHPMMQARGGN